MKISRLNFKNFQEKNRNPIWEKIAESKFEWSTYEQIQCKSESFLTFEKSFQTTQNDKMNDGKLGCLLVSLFLASKQLHVKFQFKVSINLVEKVISDIA